MAERLMLIAVFVAASSCARAVPEGEFSPTVAESQACPDSILRTVRDTSEERLIQEAGPRVSRQRCELVIRDAEGEPSVLRDDLRAGDRWVTYRYAGQVPEVGLEVIDVTYYEGGHVLLMSSDGSRVAAAGVPVVAPDSSGFFATSLDLEAEYDPNVIEVWVVKGGRPRLAIAVRSEEWGPSKARWRDSQTIDFVRTFPMDLAGRHREARARLRRTADGWTFEPLEP